MQSHDRRTTGLLLVASAGCMCPLWVSGKQELLFCSRSVILFHPIPLSWEPRVLNGADLCGLSWPPLASNPPAVHPSSPAHWPVPPVCRGNGRSTPPSLRSDPQDQGHSTAGVTLRFPHDWWSMARSERKEIKQWEIDWGV